MALKLSSCLRRNRLGIYYFRRVVPPDLSSFSPSRVVVRSTSTRSCAEVRRLAFSMAGSVNRLFDRLRGMKRKNKESGQIIEEMLIEPEFNPDGTLREASTGAALAVATTVKKNSPNQTATSAPVGITVNQVAALYFIHSDHLNTPRLITDQVGQAVWQWDNADPFGNNVPNENPSGLGTFTCNLRLPGQYFDKETNLHYNLARDYDSGIGRFIQPEPLGLAGDINLYRYARNNPLSFIDPDGVQAIPMPGVPPVGVPSPWNPSPGRPGDDFFNDQPRPAWPSIPIPGWLTDLFAARIYTCNMRCNVQQIDPCAQCPDRVAGTGTGKTKEAACKAAQKNATRQCLAAAMHATATSFKAG
jgi:RHS repeat-associated protein